MEIPSAFNSGLQGLQKANATAEQAAADIFASTTYNAEQQTNPANSGEVNTEVTKASNHLDLPDLNQAIVNLKVAEFQAKASIEVIKSADDVLGTLLDVTA
ncbi:hypothetical protein CMT41_00955 [Colwellia sp. MT41]|uniref:Flagellar hook protein FlgE n=1 Tax=Colwellia marinimaniae TaxID=1513592 RepID=A0ABQ0MS78_9GAMM|nr:MULTISPECIES: hypothetical protein [Colwellia]ALO33441.1 hypothetical protein CMT41_00955 [Colwellia sp. MT41]GAW95062.1 flagellar hook protein FlgE [Colwellia marinimaniae]